MHMSDYVEKSVINNYNHFSIVYGILFFGISYEFLFTNYNFIKNNMK